MKTFKVKLVAYIFLTSILLLAFVLLLEIVFRLMPAYNREWMDYNSATIWRIKKNNAGKKWTQDHPEFFQTANNEGFNDITHVHQKKEGTQRIMVIGDSYTAGFDYPIPKTFCGIIQTTLNEKFPGKYEVMNCATPAWSTEQEYAYFIKQGIKYQPDYVLLMAAPNDIRETFASHILQIENDSVSPWVINPMLKKEKLAWRLCAHSSLAQWMRKNGLLPNAVFETMLWKYFARGFPGIGSEYGWDEPLFFKSTHPVVQQANERFSVLLSAFNKRCAEVNCTLLVSIIPTETEFDQSLSDTSKYEPGKVGRWLANECAGKQIPFCPTYEKAKNSENPLNLYQSWEWHLNPAGHQFMGKTLSEFLESETAISREQK